MANNSHPPDRNELPRHVAIIMDGNGRWARSKGLPRYRGHVVGVESVRVIARLARKLGISYLTLFAFSEENWQRPRLEIRVLMALLRRYLHRETLRDAGQSNRPEGHRQPARNCPRRCSATWPQPRRPPPPGPRWT